MSFESFCRQNNIVVQHVELSTKVRGLCVKCEDYFIVAINPKFGSGSQKKTLQHEIIHIMENHFQCTSYEVEKCENEIKELINEMKYNFEYAEELCIW